MNSNSLLFSSVGSHVDASIVEELRRAVQQQAIDAMMTTRNPVIIELSAIADVISSIAESWSLRVPLHDKKVALDVRQTSSEFVLMYETVLQQTEHTESRSS